MIENPVGKVYVGQATNLRKRINNYRYVRAKENTLILNSIKKYGFHSHKFTILALCGVSELNNQERYFIRLYNANEREHGLNLTLGGQDYFSHTPEVRLKMSKAQMGNKKTLGRKQSTEEIEKRSLKTRGKKRTKYFREKMRLAMLGRSLPQATRDKMQGNANAGKKVIDMHS